MGKVYLQSLRVLGASLEEYASTLPRYLMLIDTIHVDSEALETLAQVGWRACRVPLILPPHPSSEPRFRLQFAKLELLRLEQFERTLYMDADVLALRPVAPILDVPMREGVHLAATRDLRGTPSGRIQWVDTFNCGVMVIRPNASEYVRVFGLLERDEVAYEFIMSEQGFLNKVYPAENAARLELVDGANLAVMTAFKHTWDRAFPNIRLLHYTMSKPWDCKWPYTRVCAPWLAREAALDSPAPSWCATVASVRSAVEPALRISYPCDELIAVDSAVVTMLTDELKDGKYTFSISKYVRGALALGWSLRRHITKPMHKLLLVREGVELPDVAKAQLRAVGWILGSVPGITPPRLPTFERFRSQFSKLALFGLAEYKSLLYLDADTLAVGPLDRLLDHAALFPDPQQRLAVALDFYAGKWSSTYNMGIFALRPDVRELSRVFALLNTRSIEYDVEQSEQGFMNAVFPRMSDAVVELPFEASGNSALEVRAPDYWRARLDRLVIIHFTEKKPWQCPRQAPRSSHGAPQRRGEGRHQAHSRLVDCGGGFSAALDTVASCYCVEAHRWWDTLGEVEKRFAQIGFSPKLRSIAE